MFQPAFEGQKCSLGYQVVEWLEAYACHGPGDVQGQPLDFRADPEFERFIIDAYALDPASGRRLVERAVISAPKGRAKSELAGLIGVAEALGPVRFDGFDAQGQPVGRPVTSPFIRCLATEEKQSGNTFQNIAFVLGEWGQSVHPEVYGGIKGIGDYRSAMNVYLPDGGELRSSSSGAASKDGGKETFVVPDEVHLYVLPELRNMYATVMRNLPKRRASEPWALLTTTACKLGEQSVWEVLEKQWKRGELGPEWLVMHREAKGRIDIEDRERTLRQLREVYGAAMHPVTGWMGPERTYSTMTDPTECRDEAEAARYYLNRSMSGSDAWIPLRSVEDAQDGPVAESLTTADVLRVVPAGEAVSIGFDGSLNDDSTVLRGCRMSDGFRFTLGIWEKPERSAVWQVPRTEVLARFRWALDTYRVSRAYCDPHEWRTDIDALAEAYGDRIVEWPTSLDMRMSKALDRLRTDIIKGETRQSRDAAVLVHYGNAYQRRKGAHVLVRKEYANSPRKIDAVVTDALAYEARADALANGWTSEPADSTMYVW